MKSFVNPVHLASRFYFAICSAILLPILLFPAFSAGQIITDTYQLEQEGYLRMPLETPHGIVATSNYATEIFLISDDRKHVLVSAPGAGMYNTLSPDRNLVGFKNINDEGLQAPAILDLTTGETELLHDYVWSAGQPSFFGENGYAFTIGNSLLVHRNGAGEPEEYDLGYYANIAPVSPDGRHAVFNNERDQLLVMDLSDRSVRVISEPGIAAYGPSWSRDSRKVAYMSNGGDLFVYSLDVGRNYTLGQGSDPSWHDDSRELVFMRAEIEDFELKKMYIVRSSFDGSRQEHLTDPEATAARDASVTRDGEVLYFDALERSIIRIDQQDNRKIPVFRQEPGNGGDSYLREDPGPDATSSPATSTTGTSATSTTGTSATSTAASPFFAPVSAPALASAPSLAPSVTAQELNASVLITDVPFVNQVWDTPFFSGNNYNYASCAPATAAMAIGYFRKVPPWPSSRHQGITRNYANYVALEYTAYGFAFNTVSRGVKGGMGYMWNSKYGASGSPRTTMAGYINLHDLESVQVWSLPYADMVKELEDGNPYPLCVMLTSAGHLILALGVQEGRRTVIVHDPYGNKNIAYPSYQGKNVIYDWPGYNYGNQNLVSVAWAVSARGIMPVVEYHIPKGDHDAGFASLSEALEWVNVQEELENSIRFVITEDLDERGNDLRVSYPFSMQTPLSIVAADGAEPVITLDRPFVIGAPYVTVDGNNGLDEPGLTIHYTGDMLHYHDFEDGSGPVEMPVVAVQAGAERVALKHLHLMRDEAVSGIPVAVQLGLGAETDIAPGHLTLENTRIGTESAPFYAGLFVDGVASASELGITGNTIHASHSALLFSRPVFNAEVNRNRFYVSADADGDFYGGNGSVVAADQHGGGAHPASIRRHPEFAAASLQGSGLEVRDNRLAIRESGAGNVTVDGIRLFGLSGDNLLANNMINVIPLEAASDGSRAAGIAVHTAGEGPGAVDDAGIRLYHNTVRIHNLVHTPATASLRVTGAAGDRQVNLDVRNNLWINEHQPAIRKTASVGGTGGSEAMADGNGSAAPEAATHGAITTGTNGYGDGTDCDEAGALGLCLDSDAWWNARANNWFTTVDVPSGWINGQLAMDAGDMEVLTDDDRAETVQVHFSGDTELLLDDLSRGDVALTGRGVADVPADILGNPRHPVFPYMGAHEPEPTLAPTLVGDYHIPKGDHDRGYDSLGEAFADLNANGAEGPFRFLIHQDLDETGAQLYLNREDLSAGTRMTLEPAGSDVTIRVAHPVLIENTSHVTIDGGEDRGLRFTMEDPAAGQAIWIVGSSRHVTLRNLDIAHEFGPQSNTVGVQVRRDDGATAVPEYITLDGLHIGTLEHPFRDGVRLWGTNDPMLRVRANVTGSHIVASHRGITTFFTENNTYGDNLIEITGHYADPSWYAGIYLAGTRGTTVRANQIRMLGINASSARYVAGVNINQNEGSISLINNMISVTDDFVNRGSSSASRVYGVGIHREGQGERYNFLHNTIYLGATGQTGHSAVIGWENVTSDEEPANYYIINNLLTNRHDRLNAFGWRWHVGNLRSVHSNNIDVAGRALVGWYEGENAPEMSHWCELSDADHNSTTSGVYYRSDRDLRLAEESEGDNLLAGTYLPSVSTDIFGNPRNAEAPYKGAWESLEAVLTGESDRKELSDIPDAFLLQQNYPNPFNAQTSIRFNLPVDSKVRLEVYNVVGQRIVTLVDGMQPAGSHTVSFDATQLASGVYVYRIQAGSYVKTHKMTLVK